MVSTLAHLGMGLLIALILGFKGKRLRTVALFSILPDLDIIPDILFFHINNSVSHEMRNQLFYIMGHREFLHSLLFIFLVTFLLWLRTKNRLLTAASFSAIILHFYVDYATTWKMHPLYPFVTESSILGSISFFDPVVNLISLLPVFVLGIKYIKRRGIGENRFKGFCTFMESSGKKVYTVLLLVLLVWIAVTPFTKFLLVQHISEVEGTRISYQDSYPDSLGTFLSAYPYNSTHYRILETSYWRGIERSTYIEKISVIGNVSDAASFVAGTKALYRTGLPQDVDYPVYTVYEDDEAVNVVLSDARNPYIKRWAYFQTVYRFVYYRKIGEYEVYASVQGEEEERLPGNWFE